MNQSRAAKQGYKGKYQSWTRHRSHKVSDALSLREVNLFQEEFSPNCVAAGLPTNSEVLFNKGSRVGRGPPEPAGD